MKVVVCRVEEFPEGERKIVKAGPRSIGVFNVEGEYFAIRNRCPHQGGPLCLGRLSPWAVATGPGQVSMSGPPRLVACPWHGWEYDLTTGQSFLGPGEAPVRTYSVSVEPAEETGTGTGTATASTTAVAQAPVTGAKGGRQPGPYVADTFPVHVEDSYVVVDTTPRQAPGAGARAGGDR